MPPVQPIDDSQIAVDPVRVNAEFYVTAAELGDAEILARIRHRVRLRRRGRIALRPTGDAVQERARTAANDLDEVLPVIDETRLRIRVVIEDDDARFALWIDRDDAWLALGAPVQLADRSGRIVKDTGVFATLGAPVDITDRTKGRRRVLLPDEQLVLEGWVATSVLGHVWTVPRGDRTPTDMKQRDSVTWSQPKDPRPLAVLATGAKLRARAAATAPVIASVRGDKSVVAIAERRGAWTLVEVTRPYARVRGFVETTAVVPIDDPGTTHSTGGGHGFGMSHADRIEVPAGTCLFDDREGQVIGVQLAASVRLGHRRDDGWSVVYVDNPWAVASLYVRDISSDPKQPSLASCTAEPHRR